MINISEKEFLDYLEKYASKEISMPKLVKLLETDYRTLNNKIIEISIDNPNLYYKIIMNHPYKQKSRSDIDFEALAIYIIKHNITIGEAVDIFNVSRRTIQRRINELKDTNPNLYELFKMTVGREATKKTAFELQEKVKKLDYKNVIIGDINEEREKFLESIEKRFNDLVATGMTHKQAAKEMGYNYQYVWKVLNELYRIKIEKDVTASEKSKKFREELKKKTELNADSIDKINDNGILKAQNKDYDGSRDEER